DGWWIDDVRLLKGEPVAGGGPGVTGVLSTLTISNVTWSAATFNPSGNERASLRYRLSDAARVTITVYHQDGFLVRQLRRDQQVTGGDHREEWEGKDVDGRVVPNGAYFFVIEATAQDGKTKVYDPPMFSGGDVGDIREARVDPEADTISYHLPKTSRVFV